MTDKRRTENKNYYMIEIENDKARELVKTYHYSGKVVNNSKLHLGVFDKKDDSLCGVLSYGYCMNPVKTPGKIVAGATMHDMFELNRMAMRDDAPKLSESQAIGLSIKWIKRYMPHIKWLLSFSDGKEDNFGIIYQATNWKYLGYMKSDSFYKLDGQYIHRVTIYGRYKRNKPEEKRTEKEVLMSIYENVSVLHCKQFIYVYPLQPGVEFLLPEENYPKKGIDSGIIKEVVYKENGVILDKKKDVYPEVAHE